MRNEAYLAPLSFSPRENFVRGGRAGPAGPAGTGRAGQGPDNKALKTFDQSVGSRSAHDALRLSHALLTGSPSAPRRGSTL